MIEIVDIDQKEATPYAFSMQNEGEHKGTSFVLRNSVSFRGNITALMNPARIAPLAGAAFTSGTPIILGGTGGLGLLTTSLLQFMGSICIILVSRNSSTSDLSRIVSSNCMICSYSSDASQSLSRLQCQSALQLASHEANCFTFGCSGILRDTLI